MVSHLNINVSCMNRREFMYSIPVVTALSSFTINKFSTSQRFKISLNAYSFNKELKDHKISLADVLNFCKKTGFDAIDITGYYFDEYPAVPSDVSIFNFKRQAHSLGIEISGTGVRNEFSYEKGVSLDNEIQLVNQWIEVAAKLGAPVLRIFSAKQYVTGMDRKKVFSNIQWALSQVLPVAEKHGVLLGIQNHNDFLHTADECFELIESMNNPWLGLVVDTGNFIAEDPYKEIEKVTPLAVNWQIKEKLLVHKEQVPMDLERLCSIIRSSKYAGNLPIETLDNKDPFLDIPVFFNKVKNTIEK